MYRGKYCNKDHIQPRYSYGLSENYNRAGFTLMELLIVMAVLVIAIAIVVPIYTGQAKGQEVVRAASQIATDLRDMRQRSADNNAVYKTVISSNQYIVQKVVGANSTTVVGPVVFNGNKVNISSATVTFNANDLSANTNSSVQVSSVDGTINRYIKIAKATGRVRVSTINDTQDGE